jgi:hypothetical protein
MRAIVYKLRLPRIRSESLFWDSRVATGGKKTARWGETCCVLIITFRQTFHRHFEKKYSPHHPPPVM